MTSRVQLPLPFAHSPGYAAADLLEWAGNTDALAWLGRTPEWPSGRLALWGEPGCGKTHLLHLWAGRRGAALLSGPGLRGLPPAPGPAGVAIDDADAVGEEPALLHLLNAAADAASPVLLAGRTPPARWPVRLPDLASRLRAITAVEILPPDDTVLGALLARLISDRQLAVPDALRDWLLARLPRNVAALRDAAERLDRAALSSGGRITRPLAAAVLAEIGAEESPAPAPHLV